MTTPPSPEQPAAAIPPRWQLIFVGGTHREFVEECWQRGLAPRREALWISSFEVAETRLRGFRLGTCPVVWSEQQRFTPAECDVIEVLLEMLARA